MATQHLSRITYDFERAEAELCVVCQCDVNPDETAANTGCGHVYHVDCMAFAARAATRNEVQLCCPTCRSALEPSAVWHSNAQQDLTVEEVRNNAAHERITEEREDLDLLSEMERLNELTPENRARLDNWQAEQVEWNRRSPQLYGRRNARIHARWQEMPQWRREELLQIAHSVAFYYRQGWMIVTPAVTSWERMEECVALEIIIGGTRLYLFAVQHETVEDVGMAIDQLFFGYPEPEVWMAERWLQVGERRLTWETRLNEAGITNGATLTVRTEIPEEMRNL